MVHKTEVLWRSRGEESTRLHNLDKLKVLCSFLIVCIHAPFPGIFGQYFTSLTRIAVPIFLMISGYFFSVQTSYRQIKKLVFLVLYANGIYFVWNAILAVLRGELVEWISDTFSMKNIIVFFLLNDDHIQSHLWYLGAILYVVIIVTALSKICVNTWTRILWIITPLLLLGDLILGKYSLLILNCEIPYSFVRNWLFVGIPYFSIGIWLKEHQKGKKISRSLLLSAIVLFAFTTLLERYLLVINNLNAGRDHYISTTFLSISVFIFFLSYVGITDSKVAKIGHNDSTWIYILHPIIITVIGIAVERIGIVSIYGYMRPMIVFLLTAFVVELIMKVKGRLKSRSCL